METPEPNPGQPSADSLWDPRMRIAVAYDPKIVSDMIRKSIIEGRYERNEILTAVSVVSAEDRVLELGAGLGIVATHISRLAKPAAYHAVEADPLVASLAVRTLRLNDVRNVTVHNCVMTSDPGELERGAVNFVRYRNFWASRVVPDPQPGSISVPVRSLTDFVRDEQITMLVCDIEGAELRALDGADLTSVRAIAMEAHPDALKPKQIRRLLMTLLKQGFSLDLKRSYRQFLCFQRV